MMRGEQPFDRDSGRAAPLELTGMIELRRVGRWRFPVYAVVHDGVEIAAAGRWGWLRIYFGSGVRIDLAGGSHWRIRSATMGGHICPLVIDQDRRKVAIAAPGAGNYGISTRTAGYGLYPHGRRRWSSRSWTLREHDHDVAGVTRRPLTVEAAEPVHLGALLLSLVLIRYGLPDDARPRIPAFNWS